MKNEMKYYLRGVLYYLVSMMANGAVLQTFLLELPLPAETVSVYVSVTQVVQMAVMLLAGVIQIISCTLYFRYIKKVGI